MKKFSLDINIIQFPPCQNRVSFRVFRVRCGLCTLGLGSVRPSVGFGNRQDGMCLPRKAKHMLLKILDTIFCLSIRKSPSLHAIFFDTPRCVSRHSTLSCFFLHVNFPFSILNFQL